MLSFEVSGVEVDGVDLVLAAWLHEGRAAEVVRAFKYGRQTAEVTPLADQMAVMVMACSTARRAELVTWVPCSPSRRRERGFDPAELLARALARRLRLRARGLLRRLDDEPQTARSVAGRRLGPSLSARSRRVPARVIVVDDVCTTGSTLRAAAAALRDAGACAVMAVVATAAQRDDAPLR